MWFHPTAKEQVVCCSSFFSSTRAARIQDECKPEIFSSLCDFMLQSLLQSWDVFLQVGELQHLPDICVAEHIKRIEVHPQSPREQNGVLKERKVIFWIKMRTSGRRDLFLSLSVCLYCTCGMIVSLFLRSCRPMVEISTSSMMMRPPAASMMRNRQLVRLDFPAPVRPTMPIWAFKRQCSQCLSSSSSTYRAASSISLHLRTHTFSVLSMLQEIPCSTRSNPGLYRTL